MTSEYWMIRMRRDGRNDAYWTGVGWSPNRLQAHRWLSRSAAQTELASLHVNDREHCRIVHVRIRPRHERLYLAERLKAWEPAIKAALAYQEFGALDDMMDLGDALDAIPKEHRP